MTTAPTPASHERWTLRELLDWTQAKFEQLGIDQPRTDAQYLLSHALGCSRMDLYLQLDRLLDQDERASFRELVKRRIAREPVAYIEGRRGFHALDLDLQVNASVLIPRPETEHLVDWALSRLGQAKGDARVLDVGTGSGAIALAIKHGCPQATVQACDVSDKALEVAKANAAKLGLEVEFFQSDLLADIRLETPYDLICANLPYIPKADLADLAPEVRDYEPQLALDGGPEGLDLIERLVQQIQRGGWLAKGGALLLEFGIGQAPAIEALLRAHGFAGVQCRRDYAQIERIICASVEPVVDASSQEPVLELDPDPRDLAHQALAEQDESPGDEPSAS